MTCSLGPWPDHLKTQALTQVFFVGNLPLWYYVYTWYGRDQAANVILCERVKGIVYMQKFN